MSFLAASSFNAIIVRSLIALARQFNRSYGPSCV
jgi:hypothetical protein